MEEETITVEFVFGGRKWRSSVGRNSIIGALAAGDFETAEEALDAMLSELNDIPGVEAKASIEVDQG